MNFILLDDDLPVGNFLDKVYEKYPKSCRLYLNKRNFKENLHYLDERPILLSHYLVILAKGTNVKQVIEAMKTNNLVILQVKNEDEVKEYSIELDKAKIQYRYIDNTKKRDMDVINWVMKELPISEKDARYLCNRHAVSISKVTSKSFGSFNIRAVVNSVNILRPFETINRKIIKTYTDKRLHGSINQVVDSLLGLSTLPKAKVIEIIERYQYGIDFLLKFINDQLENYLLMYKLIEEGEVSYENYKEYQPQNEYSDYSKISEYRRKKILDAYAKVSFELLYFTKLRVKLIPHKRTSIYELIALLKEGV